MTRNPIAHIVAAVILAAATVLMPGGSAEAASTICSEIAARLTSMATAPIAGAGRYDHAIAIQQRELRRADEEMRRLRCGFAVSGSAVERCASLARQTDEMEANLAMLRRDAAPEPYSVERERLLRLSAAKGCLFDSEPTTGDVVRILRPGGADDLAVTGPANGDPSHIVLRRQRADFDPNGPYRTLCVRTCDGYYFPISYAVTPAQFAADEAACQRRCPGTDVQLYFHRIPAEDAERMVSVADGTPYTALPHAFLYRKTGRQSPVGCSCRETAGGVIDSGKSSERGFRVLSPDGSGTAPAVEGSFVTIPAPAVVELPAEAVIRPTVSDPVTGSSEAAGPSRQAAAKPAEKTAPDMQEPTVSEPVRVVGPKFFPDPSEAEVLRAPGPTHGR